MYRRILIVAVWGAMAVPGGAAEKPPPALTAREQSVFNDLYKQRIEQATSRRAKEKMAKELLSEAGAAEGGLKYLLLSAAKDLAVGAGDLATAVGAAEQAVTMKRGDANAQAADLLDLQVKCFYQLARKRVPAKERAALKKQLSALVERIADNATALGNTYRSRQDYAAAEKAEKLAERPASLVSCPRLGQLRQGIALSQTLQGLVRQAVRFVNLGRFAEARWHYLDAGLYDEASKLKVPEPDATAELLLRVARADKPDPPELLEAAKAWDKRAVGAKGTLEQIRLTRAAELYQRCIDVGDEAAGKLARLRFQAIAKKLGDLLAALKKPGEWVYLVNLPRVSARVGWGSFGNITRAKGPIGIAGTNFATGLSVHASSKVVYSLRGRYRQLSIYYGLRTGAGGAASFEIVCDGKSVFKSAGTWSNHRHGVTKPTVVSLVGVDKLELVTHALRGGQGAFSAWGDPKAR